MSKVSLGDLGIRVLTFKRGVHPNGYEHFSEKEPITTLPTKENQLLYFPMSQHIGAPCEPIVSVGDEVVVGQKIATGAGFVTTSIHSSVSGNVVDIKEVLTVNGNLAKSIIIENDGKDTAIENFNVRRDYSKFTRDEILEIIKDYGLVGLGGAGFPTFIKLNPPSDKKIDYIIVNSAECEPFLTTDHRLMLERGELLIEGLEIILNMHEGAKGIIGIETNKLDAIENLVNLTKDKPNIEIIGLVPKYPQGSEKQLIEACTGRIVKSGTLPADSGCIVVNTATTISVMEAVAKNKPLIDRVVCFTGDCVVKPGNYETRIGTLVSEISEFAGGIKDNTKELISGGPMMGQSLFTLDVPVVKATGGILALSGDISKTPPEINCIKCARCVDHCPISLLPLELNRFALKGNLDGFEEYNGLDCIECGSCSYICPSKRHLAQSIRTTKRAVLANKRK